MPKIAATFDDQQHADAVVSELGRMNVDGLDWRVYQPGDGSASATPIVGIPASVSGNGVRSGDGGPAVIPPFIAGTDGANGDLADDNDEDGYLRQARARGATVVVADVPTGAEEAVRDLFGRHRASNMTVS